MELTSFHLLIVTVRITSAPTNQTVNETDTATFRCGTSGNPPANITWIKDEGIVDTGDTLSFLALRNLSGRYWCSAVNGFTDPVNASAYLDVQCKCVLIIKNLSYHKPSVRLVNQKFQNMTKSELLCLCRYHFGRFGWNDVHFVQWAHFCHTQL